ncbi:ShlB/FhaC/HecB family hemolysin secretion/activation protein [Candidatus Neptunochlamydia vexilliferae]|nr:ShlB/FhaC/HecB family hemolysin secretion/activation protein [Candidatus Neptunochlamydia vexilliferae]
MMRAFFLVILLAVSCLLADDACLVEHLRAIVLSNKSEAIKKEELGDVCGVRVVGVKVVGSRLAWGRFTNDLGSRFLNKPLSQEQLQEIKGAIAVYYEKKGHPFVEVIIPPQEVTEGVLQVLIHESTLGGIETTGNRWTSSGKMIDNIHLEVGEPIDTNTLNADLAFLNRNPFRQTNAVFMEGKMAGTTDLELVTKELRPFRIYAGIDNRGNKAYGKLRQFGGFNWGNFLGLGQTLSYQITTSVDKITDLIAHAGYYEVPLPYRQALVCFGGYSRIKNGEVGAESRNEGHNVQASGRYHFPLFARGKHYNDFSIGFDFKESNNNALLSEDPVFVNITNLSQFLINYQYQSGWPWGTILADLGVYFSPARMFSHQSEKAYQLLAPGARPKYFYVKGELSSRFHLPMCFGISFRFSGQIANQNLLPSEQEGLGGFDTVRGYRERILNGDDAIFSSIEFTAPPLSILGWKVACKKETIDKLTFLAFIDYGWAQVHKKVKDPFTGQLLTPSTSYIVGVGPGVRYFIDPYLNLAAYWGFRLHKTEFEDSLGGRVNFSLVISY